jgi:2-polyprenyl-6-hydroxyphenyl methylase/3-demethylubiquinone-9 3-methyltransferase
MPKINNEFYNELNEEWYNREDHPVALLRAENAVRIPWIAKTIPSKSSVLDVGCGAGFLTNALAKEGHRVAGIDLSSSSLEMAQKKDSTKSVNYLEANAYSLPFESAQFDVVTAMDVLEHVNEPNRLLSEASRVLKPGGMFFFHTFNRNPLSYVIIIKGVEWCVRNTPKNMHVYSLFIKPKELKDLCAEHHMSVHTLKGFRPSLSLPFWKMLATRTVSQRLAFQFCRSLATGYCGYAYKNVNI